MSLCRTLKVKSGHSQPGPVLAPFSFGKVFAQESIAFEEFRQEEEGVGDERKRI